MHVFVIPVYGESPYLEKCIQSLLHQTVKSKIIITTSTPTAFAQYLALQYNIPYFINDASTGIADDWNFALLNSADQLVTLAHQDDIYEPNFTALVLKELTKAGNKKVLMIFTDCMDLIASETRKHSLNRLVKNCLLLPFLIRKSISNSFFKKLPLLFGDPICCPTVTLNLKEMPDLKFSTTYKCVLDWHAWYTMAERSGAFIFINQQLVQHRIHPDSETTKQLYDGGRHKEELQIFEMIWGKQRAKWLCNIYAFGHKNNRN